MRTRTEKNITAMSSNDEISRQRIFGIARGRRRFDAEYCERCMEQIKAQEIAFGTRRMGI